MILYFTSTGNCKYSAEKLATELGDKAVSILETDNVKLSSGEKLGFVFPTCFWRLPSIVDEYMKTFALGLLYSMMIKHKITGSISVRDLWY